jgi:hypothetical protein
MRRSFKPKTTTKVYVNGKVIWSNYNELKDKNEKEKKDEK